MPGSALFHINERATTSHLLPAAPATMTTTIMTRTTVIMTTMMMTDHTIPEAQAGLVRGLGPIPGHIPGQDPGPHSEARADQDLGQEVDPLVPSMAHSSETLI